MIKLSIIKTNPDWLEATWSNEDSVLCESFSGHKEHIDMLRAKCLEFGTELSEEDEVIITEISEAFVYPTEEQIAAEKVQHQIQEAKNYLASTDYKMTVDYFATLEKAEQDNLIKLRAECREFIRANNG